MFGSHASALSYCSFPWHVFSVSHASVPCFTFLCLSKYSSFRLCFSTAGLPCKSFPSLFHSFAKISLLFYFILSLFTSNSVFRIFAFLKCERDNSDLFIAFFWSNNAIPVIPISTREMACDPNLLSAQFNWDLAHIKLPMVSFYTCDCETGVSSVSMQLIPTTVTLI